MTDHRNFVPMFLVSIEYSITHTVIEILLFRNILIKYIIFKIDRCINYQINKWWTLKKTFSSLFQAWKRGPDIILPNKKRIQRKFDNSAGTICYSLYEFVSGYHFTDTYGWTFHDTNKSPIAEEGVKSLLVIFLYIPWWMIKSNLIWLV